LSAVTTFTSRHIAVVVAVALVGAGGRFTWLFVAFAVAVLGAVLGGALEGHLAGGVVRAPRAVRLNAVPAEAGD